MNAAVGDIPEVLFVCTHNAGRSQMAAVMLDHQAGGRVRVTSAGSQPADQLNPAVVAAMAEIGLDISREFPRRSQGARRGVTPGSWSSPERALVRGGIFVLLAVTGE